MSLRRKRDYTKDYEWNLTPLPQWLTNLVQASILLLWVHQFLFSNPFLLLASFSIFLSSIAKDYSNLGF